jgi:hypothetical protein
LKQIPRNIAVSKLNSGNWHAEVIAYSRTHSRLLVEFHDPSSNDWMYLIAISVLKICGALKWSVTECRTISNQEAENVSFGEVAFSCSGGISFVLLEDNELIAHDWSID